MATDIKPIIEAMFAGVEARDLDLATAHFSDDIQLYDPHYPYPNMTGIAEVREGLTWGFAGMKSMGFDIDRWFLSADGLSAVVEVSTHHVLAAGGKHLDFPQVFVIDTDGVKITKMRAYEPHGPGGSVGFGLAIGHTVYRLTHRRKG
jgi:ketosteroid isomerase-like protein